MPGGYAVTRYFKLLFFARGDLLAGMPIGRAPRLIEQTTPEAVAQHGQRNRTRLFERRDDRPHVEGVEMEKTVPHTDLHADCRRD